MLNKSVYYFMSVAKVYYSFRLCCKLLIVMISGSQFCLYSLTYLLCIVLRKWLIAKDMQNIRPSVLSWKLQIFTFLFQSTLLLSWQLLNSFRLNSTNFCCWLLVLLSMSRRDHYDEMIYPSAKYKLFTYTRQFCIKNITLWLSYDNFFRICHAVNAISVPVLALSQTYPFPVLRRSLFQSLSLCLQHSPT